MANTSAPNGFQVYQGTGTTPSYEQQQVAIASTNTNQIFFGDPVTQLASGYVDIDTVTGTTITVTGATGTGSVATLTYSAIAAANVPPVGAIVVVAGLASTGAGYNGTYRVLTSSTTSLTYASNYAGTYVSGGTINGQLGVLGIFQGCNYISVSQKRRVYGNYWPGADAAADVTAYIISDPNAQFDVQTANSNTTATAVGIANIGSNINFSFGAGGNTSSGLSGAYADQYTIGTQTYLPFKIVGLRNYTPGAVSPLASINGNDATTAYNHIIVKFNNLFDTVLAGI